MDHDISAEFDHGRWFNYCVKSLCVRVFTNIYNYTCTCTLLAISINYVITSTCKLYSTIELSDHCSKNSNINIIGLFEQLLSLHVKYSVADLGGGGFGGLNPPPPNPPL